MADSPSQEGSFGVGTPGVPGFRGSRPGVVSAEDSALVGFGHWALFLFLALAVVPNALKSQGFEIAASVSYFVIWVGFIVVLGRLVRSFLRIVRSNQSEE